MPSGRSRRLAPLSTDPASVPDSTLDTDTDTNCAPTSRQTLVLPVAPAPPSSPLEPPRQTTMPARERAQTRAHRRRWPRLVLGALVPPALLFVVLVPPQSLRATLVTLLIVAALSLVVWRLPMSDDD